MKLQRGQFCFLSNRYYRDFPDPYLMKNKEIIDGTSRGRPSFFVFPDPNNAKIYWLVPISSRYDKFKEIYDHKVRKYGICQTIRFGTVLGTKAAFLIQNMHPTTEQYIKELYVDKHGVPVKIDDRIVEDVTRNAQEVLEQIQKGVPLVFPDVKKIYQTLEKQLERESRWQDELEREEEELER